jgi:hypothetical protein
MLLSYRRDGLQVLDSKSSISKLLATTRSRLELRLARAALTLMADSCLKCESRNQRWSRSHFIWRVGRKARRLLRWRNLLARRLQNLCRGDAAATDARLCNGCVGVRRNLNSGGGAATNARPCRRHNRIGRWELLAYENNRAADACSHTYTHTHTRTHTHTHARTRTHAHHKHTRARFF